jgi:hypothetical protein
VDPRAVLKTVQQDLEDRRAELVARAAADRAGLTQQLEPLLKLERGLEKLRDLTLGLPTTAIGTGLALSAMMLALPAGRSPLVRGGIAVIQLAASVKRLFTRERSA